MAKPKAATHDGLPLLPFVNKTAFDRWLAKNHARDEGIWLELAKKSSGIPSIDYAGAREIAIRWGWIDGLKHSIDDRYYALRFTPRRKRSKWSQINREIAEQLIEAGRMKPPGLAQVEAARDDGRWDAAYPPASAMKVPDDFAAALNENRKAKAAFAEVSKANRYAMLYRLYDAKRPATRARRIEQFVEMLAAGEVLHPDR